MNLIDAGFPLSASGSKIVWKSAADGTTFLPMTTTNTSTSTATVEPTARRVGSRASAAAAIVVTTAASATVKIAKSATTGTVTAQNAAGAPYATPSARRAGTPT